jgi:hypothetical protein
MTRLQSRSKRRAAAWRHGWLAIAAIAVGGCGGKAVVDPGSGGSGAGGTSGTGTSSSTSGTGTTGTDPCDALPVQYAQALATAHSCNPAIDSPQCTLVVDDKLDCPCSTYVNPDNVEAVAQLGTLQSEWQVAHCTTGCPPISCPVLQGAGCAADGQCTDYGLD